MLTKDGKNRRVFNVAGPCIAKDHYMIPDYERDVDLMPLIENKDFFVFHAARQCGKTTLFRNYMNKLEASGDYYALYCSLESAYAFNEPVIGIQAVFDVIKEAVESHFYYFSNNAFVDDIKKIDLSDKGSSIKIKTYFKELCQILDKPLVVFFDEADCLSNGTLITFLRQLRDGYINRESIPFIHSLALIGLRNIRDYKSSIRDGHLTLGSASPFNIVKKSLTMSDFNFEQVKNLYNQHTQDTGQIFTDEAINKAFYYSQGQPWIVNALAREAIQKILLRDHTKIVDQNIMQQAAANLMKRRDTHIDSLMDKLKEPRVKSIIEPLINGQNNFDLLSDDFEYVKSLGLIKIVESKIKIANPVYSEIISRTLNYNLEMTTPVKYINRWVGKDKILMNELLTEFQAYWRENSELPEIFSISPQLFLPYFLQNALKNIQGIHITENSYQSNIDLCVCYRPDGSPEGRAGELYYPIEIKVMRKDNQARVRKEGIEQINKYMDRYDSKEGWLVIFDRLDDPKTTWDDKIYFETLRPENRPLDMGGTGALADPAAKRVVHVLGA
jgi:hypothetical protein